MARGFGRSGEPSEDPPNTAGVREGSRCWKLAHIVDFETQMVSMPDRCVASREGKASAKEDEVNANRLSDRRVGVGMLLGVDSILGGAQPEALATSSRANLPRTSAEA